MASNTAITVVSAAKLMNRKKSEPQSRPNGMLRNTFGSVTNMRPGPSPGFTPYAKHAGITMSPAETATSVSSSPTWMPSPRSVRSRPT